MYHPILDIAELASTKESIVNFENLFFDIIQVGCGGNGGYLVQRLSKMLYSFSQVNPAFRFRYTLVDGDHFEENNLMRQPCIEEDLNLPKAKVLSERYGTAYQIPIFHHDRYIDSYEELQDMLQPKSDKYMSIPIIIGCVDNNASRHIMYTLFEMLDTCLYIDSGVDGVLNEGEGTKEEINESGYSGHVVCGFRLDDITYLDSVCDVYENIMYDTDSLTPTQACGVTVVNNPQRMQSNETAALIMAGYLNTILGEGRILSHFTNFNARTMLINPRFISKDVLEELKALKSIT